MTSPITTSSRDDQQEVDFVVAQTLARRLQVVQGVVSSLADFLLREAAHALEEEKEVRLPKRVLGCIWWRYEQMEQSL